MLRVGDYVALRTRIREGEADKHRRRDADSPSYHDGADKRSGWESRHLGGAKVRLYNVVEDPFQKNDLSGLAEQQERLRDMERILEERLRK